MWARRKAAVDNTQMQLERNGEDGRCRGALCGAGWGARTMALEGQAGECALRDVVGGGFPGRQGSRAGCETKGAFADPWRVQEDSSGPRVSGQVLVFLTVVSLP